MAIGAHRRLLTRPAGGADRFARKERPDAARGGASRSGAGWGL